MDFATEVGKRDASMPEGLDAYGAHAASSMTKKKGRTG
jgi:hypothetical protein